MKVLLVTTLILVVAFLEEGEGRRSSLTRMTRSDPAGPALEEVGGLFIENEKRMTDFGLRERMRPRMGKRMFAGPEEEEVGPIANMKRMADFGFSEKTRPRMGKRFFNNGRYQGIFS